MYCLSRRERAWFRQADEELRKGSEMKKTIVAFLCLIVVAANGCAGKYSDVRKLNAEFVKMTEAYVADLDKAQSAKDVAKAIDKYADQMQKIAPQMQRVSEKYPELKDNDKLPEELKESPAVAEEVAKKMVGTFMKIAPYMQDPEVQKAQKRLAEAMMAK